MTETYTIDLIVQDLKAAMEHLSAAYEDAKLLADLEHNDIAGLKEKEDKYLAEHPEDDFRDN